jgi:hypothetical protein
MLDKLVFRVMPALLLVGVFLLYYPPTANRIRQWVSHWYYSRYKSEAPILDAPYSSLTRSIFSETSHWSQAS